MFSCRKYRSMDEIASIFYLIACIAEAVTSSRRIFPFTPQTQGISWTFLFYAFDHMEKAMLSDEWCPLTIRIISEQACVLSYASTRRPYVRDAIGHQKCRRNACVINTIDTSSYSNKHTMEACACVYSKPPLEQVAGSLERGAIPVVYQLPINNNMSSCSASQTSYIAISHLWADGLGSTTEVGLPTCQINRLAGIARRLIPSGAFWMDALCIPERRDTRKRAIGLMAQTYRNADAVLVIDAGIRSCSLYAPPEERLLRILSSGWMQRLWSTNLRPSPVITNRTKLHVHLKG
ncbi:hypothetical protein DFS33DRAFT_1112154 [Desarmillaria ectypa]|nr:hypothetical protein DFS33DRAFT_1112154 [Desarmillaria ectypa]